MFTCDRYFCVCLNSACSASLRSGSAPTGGRRRTRRTRLACNRQSNTCRASSGTSTTDVSGVCLRYYCVNFSVESYVRVHFRMLFEHSYTVLLLVHRLEEVDLTSVTTATELRKLFVSLGFHVAAAAAASRNDSADSVRADQQIQVCHTQCQWLSKL